MNSSFFRTARLGAVIAIPLLFAAAMPLADGMTYDFVMKTQSTRTGNKETVTMSGHGAYSGDQARIEISDAGPAGAGGMFGGKGSYFIVKGGGKEMFLVDPSQKQYMAWDIAGMLGGMSKMMGAMGGMVKMQMSDVHIDAQDMGAGESVQGYPTRHIRMVQNYVMTATVFGRSNKTTTATTTDYYLSPSLKIANPFVSNSQQMAMASDMFNNPDYKTQMSAAMAKMPKGSIPLKTISTAISTDSKGKQETTISKMEMLNMHAGNVPASVFAIPHDYALVQMPNMNMAGGGNGAEAKTEAGAPDVNVDSVAAAAKAGASDATKNAAKDAARNAASKKLKGIFKH
ncbi:MAG: hypothetical protein ABIZ36_12695 [Gemmatimonadaceae bacterium]